MRALKVVDIGDHDPLAQLNDIAAELRKLHTRVNADTLAMAELLHDVQAHNLVMYEPGYDPEVWKKKPDGTRAAIVDWHKREVGPITPARVTQLISAGAVVTAVTTGSPELMSEWQIRPLTKLLAKHRKHIPTAWKNAVELAGEKPVTNRHVLKAAKAIAPDAFKTKPKPIPGNTVKKYGDYKPVLGLLETELQRTETAAMTKAIKTFLGDHPEIDLG
jgi:hypothetical protein